MLNQIIETIRTEKAPISVQGLSRRLDIDQSALEGMLAYLSQKGIIVNQTDENLTEEQTCTGLSCKGCSAASGCPFSGRQPKRYTLTDG